MCKISYQANTDLTAHNKKIHTQYECKICKTQKYGENEFNDHTKSCKHKRDKIRQENDKKDAERRKAHPKYTNVYMHLMDETPAMIEKITETDKIDNEMKQMKKEERKKVTADKKAPKNTKK